jgi:glyoxylase-like metal-dependent hydrolase (beta-lactamase superfamily II)
LVDCGLGIADLKLFLLENKIDNTKIFITHAHFDHVGGVNQFLPKDLIITEKVFLNLHKRKFWGLEYLSSDQIDSNHVSRLGFDLERFCQEFEIQVPNAELCRYNKINLGNRCFEIINLPGHTDDSTVLYDRNNKVLFSGDALYDGDIYCNLPNSNKVSFIQSLEKIRNLEVDIFFPGHNDPPILNKQDFQGCVNSWISKLRAEI